MKLLKISSQSLNCLRLGTLGIWLTLTPRALHDERAKQFFHVKFAEITTTVAHKVYTCCTNTYIQNVNTGHEIFKLSHCFENGLATVSLGRFS